MVLILESCHSNLQGLHGAVIFQYTLAGIFDTKKKVQIFKMKQQICHGRKPYVVKVSFMQCFDAEFPLLKLKMYYFCLKLIIYVTRQFSLGA